MFPLTNRKLIRGAAEHVKAGLAVAADYVAVTGTPYYAPFTGTLSVPYGPNGQGGIWLRLTRPNGDKIEVAHLEKYVKSSGGVTEGELVAYTDNTGKVTSGDHAHIQIFDKNNKRLDPEKYDWGSQQGVKGMKVTVGVTVQAIVNTIGYDQPGAGHEKQQIQKGQLGEITQVSDDNWCVVNFANVYTYWVQQKDFQAVPRSNPVSDSDKKLEQAKALARDIQAASSKQISL